MGEQWTRLTPENVNDAPRYNGVRTLHPGADGLSYELYTRWVTAAEALAFARQVPEVQALAEDLREATLICQGQLALNRHIGNVTVTEEWEQRIGRYMLHLAPFEEVPDATE